MDSIKVGPVSLFIAIITGIYKILESRVLYSFGPEIIPFFYGLILGGRIYIFILSICAVFNWFSRERSKLVAGVFASHTFIGQSFNFLLPDNFDMQKDENFVQFWAGIVLILASFPFFKFFFLDPVFKGIFINE